MSDRPVPPQQGDEHELFERYSERLRRVTRFAISTSPEIVDDACAFAWMQLLSSQPRRETVWGWLRVVARNRALELDQLARSQASAEVSIDTNNGHDYLVTADRGRVEVALATMELRERLQRLPQREREIVFLNAAGWRYVELAERLGISYTRVNQLLVRANRRFREMDRRELEPTTPRGRRLREIEREPPRYITAAIGRRPRENARGGDQALIREWKRLVLEIEDYRTANGVNHAVLPLGRESGDQQQELLRQRIAGYRRDRGLSKGIEI